MQRSRLIAFAVSALVACGVALAYLQPGLFKGRLVLPFAITIGSPFTLTSHEGKAFDSRSLAGKPHAIFFGFTNCPDICPTTLLDMTNHLKTLGKRADQLAVLFVTVDPEHDTPDHLKRYLANFDPRIVGLTGPAADIRKVARSFRVSYRKVATPGGYTVDHTASVFLMGADGVFKGTMSFEDAEAVQVRKLKELVGD